MAAGLLRRCAIFRKVFELGMGNKEVERQDEFLDMKSAAHFLGKAEKMVYAMAMDMRPESKWPLDSAPTFDSVSGLARCCVGPMSTRRDRKQHDRVFSRFSNFPNFSDYAKLSGPDQRET
jgi:hypothetical protein